MEKSEDIVHDLLEMAKRWEWANPEVHGVCQRAATHIQHLENRIKDRDAWLKDAIDLERELYKGSG